MSRRLAALRIALAVVAVSALAACASPTAPTSSRLRAPTVSHDDISPDSTCRGYSLAQGFKC
jgi:hypothetical protein